MRKFWESIYSPNYITGYNPFILKDMNKAIEFIYYNITVFLLLWRSLSCVSFGKVYIVLIT